MNEDHHPVGRPLGERGTELLPCPFCGGTEVVLYGPRSGLGAWVACVGCGLEAPTETGQTEEHAAQYWNLRTPDRALLDRIEELEGAAREIADATDPENPESYRSDDREGCLDTVHSIARKALSGEKQ